jgi:hypothetical protein
MASTTDGPERRPKVIRDYATEEEIESPKVEPEVEASNTSESPASVPDDITAEPSAGEVIADQADTPTPIETERTVH